MGKKEEKVPDEDRKSKILWKKGKSGVKRGKIENLVKKEKKLLNNRKRKMRKNEGQGQTRKKEGKERNTQSQEKERKGKTRKIRTNNKRNRTWNGINRKKWKAGENEKENKTKDSKQKRKRRKVEETMYHCWTSCRCSHPALQRALCWINQTRLWCFWAARYQGRETGAEPQVEAVRQPMTHSAYWSVVLPQQGRGNQVDIAFMHTLK